MIQVNNIQLCVIQLYKENLDKIKLYFNIVMFCKVIFSYIIQERSIQLSHLDSHDHFLLQRIRQEFL